MIAKGLLKTFNGLLFCLFYAFCKTLCRDFKSSFLLSMFFVLKKMKKYNES